MKFLPLSLLLLVSLGSAADLKPRNVLTCSICKDIITEIDEWITSDKTEQDIIDFFNQICLAADALIPGVGQTCTDFLNNNMHGIIESIVHENLNPSEVCTQYGLCP